MKKIDAIRIVEGARGYNIDALLYCFFVHNHPEEIRRDLMELYFMAVQSVFLEGSVPQGEGLSPFITLQNLIYSFETIRNTDEAHLTISMKETNNEDGTSSL